MGKIIIISAPSGSGKSTIINYLLEQDDLSLQFSISATSRPSRGEEEHGKEYYFITVDEFRKKIESEDFLEYEEVYEDRFYGTLKSEVERISKDGGTAIFDVDVVGGCNIKEYYKDNALSIFIKPPSIEELRCRLETRGTDDKKTIDSRIARAEYELTYEPKFDVTVVNDDLENAKKETLQIIKVFLGV